MWFRSLPIVWFEAGRVHLQGWIEANHGSHLFPVWTQSQWRHAEFHCGRDVPTSQCVGNWRNGWDGSDGSDGLEREMKEFHSNSFVRFLILTILFLFSLQLCKLDDVKMKWCMFVSILRMHLDVQQTGKGVIQIIFSLDYEYEKGL